MIQLVQDTRDVRLALDIDCGLSERTVRFLDSIARRVYDERRPLTEAQRAVLHRILEERGR